MTWLISFHCYGTKFHFPPALEAWERRAMKESSYLLDERRRGILSSAIRDICEEHGWHLFALHVRENHVHILADCGGESPREAASAFKRRASRMMNDEGLDPGRKRRWARHGCFVRVKQLDRAIEYVVRRQGAPMEVFVVSSDSA